MITVSEMKEAIRILFSDTYTPGKHDILKSLETSVRVQTDQSDTEHDVAERAKTEARRKLEQIAREHAHALRSTTGTIVNYQYDMRSGSATAELYLHGTTPKPTGHGPSKIFQI